MSKRRQHGLAGKTLVAFEVAGVAYALDIARVREIVRPLPTLSLPHVPDTVVGVVDHRGDVVPIVDLRLRFGVQGRGSDRDRRWIIVSRGSLYLGLAVDRVSEVFGVEDASARDLPSFIGGEVARGIKAAYSHRDQLVFVLDVDELTDVVQGMPLPSAAELRAGTVGNG